MNRLEVLTEGFFKKNTSLTEDQIQCAIYTLKALCNELSKVFLYSCIFAVQGLFGSFLLFYIVFVSIRVLAGGIHCHTYWSCFFVSLGFICIGVYAPFIIQKDIEWLIYTTVFSCFSPLLFSPVTPSFRVVRGKHKKILLKASAVLVTLIWFAWAVLAVRQREVMISILLAICLANYQLIVPGVYRYIKSKEVKT